MVDVEVLAFGCSVGGVVVVLWALSRPRVCRPLAAGVVTAARWLVHRCVRAEEMEDVAVRAAFARQRRRRLWADLRRLDRLIATDEWMSATRQLGNRMARAQVLDEIRRLPAVDPDLPAELPWDSPTTEPEPAPEFVEDLVPRFSEPEVLELGRGHRH